MEKTANRQFFVCACGGKKPLPKNDGMRSMIRIDSKCVTKTVSQDNRRPWNEWSGVCQITQWTHKISFPKVRCLTQKSDNVRLGNLILFPTKGKRLRGAMSTPSDRLFGTSENLA